MRNSGGISKHTTGGTHPTSVHVFSYRGGGYGHARRVVGVSRHPAVNRERDATITD